MSSDVTIKVENVSKCYHIYDTPRARFQQLILPQIRRRIGKSSRQYFREFWALRDVSFAVKKGETVGIIGRNGSGKSTLLQLICGTLSPTEGSVQTTGRISALLELGSGFNPEFTGRENVYMNAAILGVPKGEIDSRFDEIAAFADIGHFLDQPVKSYSSGMVVRLAFAVQAMIDPEILVVDEALAVGDEKFQRKCFARLEELKANGTSILFVSHSASSIIELCDRAIFLDRGIQLMDAEPARAVRAYQKLIYAPVEDYQKLVDEYLARDEDSEVTGTSRAIDEKNVEPSTASFDPGLVPETTVAYPTQGAEITRLAIIDDDGHLVNVLNPGSIHTIEMKGRFLSDFAGVFFGVHIRNISGGVVTGQRHPEDGVYLDNARAGAEFVVRFSFRMSLLPGAYFIGGGVWSLEEPMCAHRIIDALMFRVTPGERSMSFGYVDLMCSDPCSKIEEPTDEYSRR